MPEKRYSIYVQPIAIGLEFVLLFVTLFYFLNVQYTDDMATISLSKLITYHYKAYLILSISWFFIGSYFNLWQFERGSTMAFVLEKTFYQLLIFSILLFAVSGLKSYDLLSIKNSIYFLITYILFIYFFRIVMFFGIKRARSKGFNSRNILLVDHNENTDKYAHTLKNRKELGYRMIGMINGTNLEDLSIKNFNLDDFEKVLDKFKVDIIFLSLEGLLPSKTISDIKLVATKKKIKLNYIPSANMLGYNDLQMGYIYTYPILNSVKNPLDHFFNRLIKRAFDLIVSILSLSFLVVFVFPWIAIAIILTSGFPIFFKQKRRGVNGEVFDCYKFRTMENNDESDLKTTKRGDRRITNIGKFLRKTSLDELPQLWNVVKGDMSIVGPRPHMLQQDEVYDEIIKYYSLRHHVKPGITGLAQISGYRGEINSDRDMENRVRSDIYYIQNWSLSQDIIIMIKTVFKMIFGDENAI